MPEHLKECLNKNGIINFEEKIENLTKTYKKMSLESQNFENKITQLNDLKNDANESVLLCNLQVSKEETKFIFFQTIFQYIEDIIDFIDSKVLYFTIYNILRLMILIL